ncbi:MAG: catalase, partial [Solirubrobacteraceae bacterium]
MKRSGTVSDPAALGGEQRAERLMDLMETNLAHAPGFRRAHARGVGLRGTFTATPAAAALTVAEHMQGTAIAVVARVSNGDGNPHAADRSSRRKGGVLGLAVRFELPSGGSAQWAALNIQTFPARRPDHFIGLSAARAKGLPFGLPNPIRFVSYLLTHPPVLNGVRAILGVRAVASFATASFFGLHAYYAVDGDGKRQPFRYRWVPVAGEAGPTKADDDALGPQYLVGEIGRRIAQGPVAWDLVLQLAEPGDPTDDLTLQWPDERPLVTVGRLLLDRPHEDPEQLDDLVFDPTVVPPGIE